MQAKKLYEKMFPNEPDITEEEVGSGADGDVYSIKNDKLKVIKYTVQYCWDDININEIVSSKFEVMAKIKQENHIFANVYDFKFLGKGTRNIVDGSQNYLLFSCIMEKLNKITDDEKKIFHTLLSHEDCNKIKKLKQSQVNKILQSMHGYIDFDYDAVKKFYNNVISSKIKHSDMHPRNIMKDNFGNFKFIDFDRVHLT